MSQVERRCVSQPDPDRNLFSAHLVFDPLDALTLAHENYRARKISAGLSACYLFGFSLGVKRS